MADTIYGDRVPATATTASDLIDPEVMGQMVTEAVKSKLVFASLARENNVLLNTAGSTVTIPKFYNLQDAVELQEGVAVPVQKLKADTTTVSVKEIGTSVIITDTAVENSLNVAMATSADKIARTVSSKIDKDFIDASVASSASSKPLTQALSKKDTLAWANIVDGLVQFGDTGFDSLAGFVVSPVVFGSLLKDSDFMADTRAENKRATAGYVGSIAGAPVYLSNNLALNSKVGAVAVREGALELYWKRMPRVERERNASLRSTDIVVTSRYAVNRADDNGILVFTNPAA